jgi:hypothetical protein
MRILYNYRVHRKVPWTTLIIWCQTQRWSKWGEVGSSASFFFSLLSPAHWSNTLDWKKKKKESGRWYILQVTTTVTTPKLGELIGKGELQKKRGLTTAKTEAGNGYLYWEMIYKPWERKMDGSKTQDMLYNKVYKCPTYHLIVKT